MPSGLRSRATLTLLTLAVTYAALLGGGDQPLDSNIVLLMVAVATLAGVSAADRLDDGPRDLVLLAALLIPVYIVFQLLPLPLWIVSLVSPVRAEIARALSLAGITETWTALSVSPSWTAASVSRAVGCVLVFALIRRLGRGVVNRWALVIPLLIVGGIETAVGLAQVGEGPQQQLTGTYPSRNHFAGLLEMLFPLALLYGIECVSRRRRRHELATPDAVKGAVLLVVAVAFVTAILFSTSKGGSLAAGTSLLVMGALRVTRQATGLRRWLAITGLAVALAALFVLLIPTPLLERFGGLVEEDPSENRYPIWQDTAQLFAAYPLFGVGYGNFYSAFTRYQTSGLGLAWTAAHNDHLQLLAELGLFGFVLVAIMFGGSFFRAVREEDDRYVALGVAGSIGAFVLHAFVEFNAYVLANALTMAWVAGIGASFPVRAWSGASRPRAPLTSARRALAAMSRQMSSVSRLERWPLLTVGGVLLAVWSSVWIVFLTSYNRDPATEQAFCRFGLCDTDAVYVALQGAERDTNPKPVPLEVLRTHVQRFPSAPERWTFYAEALQAAGRTAEARQAFERSIELSPREPSALLSAADFYLATGERKRGLELIARSLAAGEIMDPAIFGELEFREVPVDEALAHLALDARATRAYLRRLMTSAVATAPDDATDEAKKDAEAPRVRSRAAAARVWAWAQDRTFADDKLAVDYAEFLLRIREPRPAADAWTTYATSVAGRLKGAPADYPSSNHVFNGDFEADPVGGPFDWRIPRGVAGVSASIDAGVGHSGTRSLRLAFDGTANVGETGVEQVVFVPEGRYALRGWMRTEGVTTDEGVTLRAVSADEGPRVEVKTEPLSGTKDWQTVQAPFDVASGGRLLRLGVSRKPSLKFDNLVRGSVWVDDVRIQPE